MSFHAAAHLLSFSLVVHDLQDFVNDGFCSLNSGLAHHNVRFMVALVVRQTMANCNAATACLGSTSVATMWLVCSASVRFKQVSEYCRARLRSWAAPPAAGCRGASCGPRRISPAGGVLIFIKLHVSTSRKPTLATPTEQRIPAPMATAHLVHPTPAARQDSSGRGCMQDSQPEGSASIFEETWSTYAKMWVWLVPRSHMHMCTCARQTWKPRACVSRWRGRRGCCLPPGLTVPSLFLPVLLRSVAVDFLAHRELFAALERLLRAGPRSLSLLDLGCGDAGHVAALLRQLAAGTQRGSSSGRLLSSYTGVDVSGDALAAARRNLAWATAAGSAVQLVQQDMKEFVAAAAGAQQQQQQHDVALSCFSLHHLR